MRLRLAPVYSKPASPELVTKVLRGRALPEGLALAEHQARTLEALEDPDVDVVANTAMTGDGKSLTGYLRALLGPCPGDRLSPGILGLYPTIELSRDQARQFEHYRERFRSAARAESLWGAKLTRLEGKEFGRRAHALIALLNTHQVILTNPDIFARMMTYQYRPGIYTLQEIPYVALSQFGLLFFDEFHVFSMPQFVSAVSALIFAQELLGRDRPKALFSSATQSGALLSLVDRAGLSCRRIEGTYSTTELPDYRLILRPADLHIHQLETGQDTEGWVKNHVDIIERAWREAGDQPPRIAIIVSSVAVARRLALALTDHFAERKLKPGGLTVQEITGLEHGSLDADIVVGTSTIDVGIDFFINLLIFEATNAGEFLQRLGRLGRCPPGRLPFASYSAHALISAKTPWITPALERELRGAGIAEGTEIDRPHTLRALVESSYPSETDFAPYAHRWGALQGCHTLHVLRHRLREPQDDGGAYAALADRLEDRYASVFQWRRFKPTGRYYRMLHDSKAGEVLLDEILSFRGSSPFQVALWDESRRGNSPDRFLPYDLLRILQMAAWAPMGDEEFFGALRGAAPQEYQERRRQFEWVMRGKNDRPLCLRISSFLDERERLELGAPPSIGDEGMLDRPVVLKGFRVGRPQSPALSTINDVLARQRVVCYVTRQPAGELRRRLRLPALFPLYQMSARHFPMLTAAFGKPALMLDAASRSHLWARRRGSSDSPIIC